ncbi:hypothetical protein TREMEDRAFT_74148 [Tremella mesenterica DSM 1558]|uniref:uncharacterized protein n=1 Tax=Tremella mesenterica (strain ATCC 24925 / CBS 8224 / DSM 1558 / NBRC 9311 / NRRL Y-6157 / RJB 2259-6 / UBC 559-6) TaxID=578456 RepID=UPI0003F48ECF|nr:uncharacterized protein TREMEDRAFT_74148 [Tremella mesenterica DSM 1558]EIW68705.1 hypothetical protein TREMEDRAFT_74148 [Tremella mesenterica DSM 1558]
MEVISPRSTFHYQPTFDSYDPPGPSNGHHSHTGNNGHEGITSFNQFDNMNGLNGINSMNGLNGSGTNDRSMSNGSNGHDMLDTLSRSTRSRSPSPVQTKKRRRPSGEKRARCANACNRCKAKKLKCFQGERAEGTCAACAKSGAECVFETPLPRHAGGEKYVVALEARIAKLESALAELDPNHPEINDHYNSSFSPSYRPNVEDLSKEVGFVSVNKSGSEQFFGESSGYTFTRTKPDPRSLVQNSSSAPPSRYLVNPNPPLPTPEVSEKILQMIYLHIQSRYGFVEWHRIRAWHARREKVCFTPMNGQASFDDRIGAFFLWVIYAVGTEFVPREAAGLETADTYLEQAMKYIDFVIAPHDITTVQGLVWLIFYGFRASGGPSIWHLCGFAMRLCVELGLHRKVSPENDVLTNELRKRVFWSVYCFDRLICLSSGRPFNLIDRDIDVELPVDVDCDSTDRALITNLQRQASMGAPLPYTVNGTMTTMTSAIHTLRLFQIRSRVQSAFYSIHAPRPTREETEGFLTELEEWRRTLPHAASNFPCQEEDKYLMIYFQAVLFTLRPGVIRATPRDPLLMLCATAAAEACELIRKVHQSPTVVHSLVSLYHIFICGMTLLHCLSVLPTVIPTRISARAIRACSSTLAIFAQLFPAAIPFRELFEYMADQILSADSFPPGQASAIGELLVGNLEPLAQVYDKINGGGNNQNPSPPLSNVPEPTLPPVQTTGPEMLTPGSLSSNIPASGMITTSGNSFPNLAIGEFANLHNFGDLASLLDFPNDGGWQHDWAEGWPQK